MNTKIITVMVVSMITIGGGSFFAGTKHQANKESSRSGNFPTMVQSGQMRNAQNGGVGTRSEQGNSVIAGEILFKDENSITLKLPDGGSKIVFFSESTTVTKSATGLITDLEINDTVMVSGSANSDGVINAQSIQIGNNGVMYGGRIQGQMSQ